MKKVLCNVYRSSKKEGMYLYLAKQDNPESMPETLQTLFGKPQLVMTLMLSEQKRLARVDASTVMDAILTKGFYLQMPTSEDAYMQKINLHNDRWQQ